MSAFRFRSRRTRRLWKTTVTLTALAAFAAVFVAGSSANLTGSTFEGNDGNLVVNTPGNTDWDNAPNRVVGVDLPTGQTDNSFGQGTQENDINVSVVTGSIPNNKADLARFAIASEFTGGSNYLYLAWSRENQSGTVNYDFEINQKTQPDLTTPGPKTLVRTAGDLLINYAFQGGSNTPTLTVRKWTAAGVWGPEASLTGSSEGATNSVTVSDTLAAPAVDRPAQQFGEAAINLTAAGVFPAGTCEAFGSAFVKSRSSTSFTSEIKDFIAPVAVNIRNCGRIVIHKKTENGNASFGYTTTGGLSPSTFTITTVSNTGSFTYDTVLAGNYTVTESTIPAGWTLKSLVCTATGSGTSVSPGGATATITMAPDGVVDCTYTNHINVSPTIATTLSATTIEVEGTVHDSATLSGATADAGGTVTYTVYTDSACSQGAQSAGTVTVTNGVVPDSNSIKFDSVGDFFWQAVYSGDANNNPATSVCTSEHLVVTKKSPSITTTLSANAVNIGGTVTDSATLSGATANAGGTVTYTVYTDSACSQGAQSAGKDLAVTNGVVPNSNPITFNSAGDFFWQVVYSGDNNNNGASSVCTSEHLVVAKNQPTVSTAQNLLPNDLFTLSGATLNAGGTITFNLYAPSDATCAGPPAYTEIVIVSGNATYQTHNNTTFAATEGTWRWQSTYSGDTNNAPASSACGIERFTIANS